MFDKLVYCRMSILISARVRRMISITITSNQNMEILEEQSFSSKTLTVSVMVLSIINELLAMK